MAAAVSALMMLSCEVQGGYIDELDRNDLTGYADVLFRNSVLLPVDMVEFAVTLDAYLTLPDEQKKEDGRFYGQIDRLADGVFKISCDGVACTVDTGGQSVWDDGAVWKFVQFQSYVSATGFYESGWSVWITDDVNVTFNQDMSGDSRLMAHVQMPSGDVLMALRYDAEQKSIWNVSVQGTDRGKTGLIAEYSTGLDTGGINVAPRYDVGEAATEQLCDGLFYVDIYNGETRIDWVRMYLNPGYKTDYDTSR